MKLFAVLILFVVIPNKIAGNSELHIAKGSYEFIKHLASADLSKEWGKKLADNFGKIARFSKNFAKFAGPAGDIIFFALSFTQDENALTKEILNKLDKMDVKLDGISNQIYVVNDKMDQSVKKILAEIKLQSFLTYMNDLQALQLEFEGIIGSFSSDLPALERQLNNFLDDYRQKAADLNLVNSLDSGEGLTSSIVQDLISAGRSYRDKGVFFGATGTSTSKLVFDLYMTALMAVSKGSLLVQSAINLKTAITGDRYDSEINNNAYRTNEILKKFYSSLERAFQRLNIEDTEAFIDFSVNGESNPVRMINVLQYLWKKEEDLGGYIDCSDSCGDFNDISFVGNGCNGRIYDCGMAMSGGLGYEKSRSFYLQVPKTDRIYWGLYDANDNYVGIRPEKDYKEIVLGTQSRIVNDCDVCRCVCDQIVASDSVRRIYTGLISAPDGYVVIGIRFTVKDKIIFPQIKVGKLLPLALIDQTSIKWQELPNSDSPVEVFNYHIRELGFGDLAQLSFADSLVTGVKFESESYGVSWSVQGRKLADYNRGILGEEQWAHSPNNLNEYSVYRQKVGIKKNSMQEFKVRKNHKIKFTVSEVASDAGQSFIPFFDGNEISFDVKTPLSGISLIHYSNDDDYGGYIRPVVRSMDYKKFISAKMEN